MNLTGENLKKLEHLLAIASNTMEKYYPDYKGRDQDSGYFELWLQSKKYQHYAQSWYERVLGLLQNDIKYELGLSQFRSVKRNAQIELIAPDAFLLHIPVLEEIVRDLRIIYYSSDTQRLLTGESTELAWKLMNNDIVINFPKSSDRSTYILFRFRNGLSLKILDHALNTLDYKVRRSELRSGGSTGIVTSKGFKEIFRRLLEKLGEHKIPEDLVFKRMLASSLTLNMGSLLVPTTLANDIKQSLRPSSKPS